MGLEEKATCARLWNLVQTLGYLRSSDCFIIRRLSMPSALDTGRACEGVVKGWETFSSTHPSSSGFPCVSQDASRPSNAELLELNASLVQAGAFMLEVVEQAPLCFLSAR